MTGNIQLYCLYAIYCLPTILNYVNGRERGGAFIFFRILAPPPPPPPPTPQYLTILMTEREGRHYLLTDFGAPNAPPPLPPMPQYVTILMINRGGAIIFCRILAPPPPSPDNTILNNPNDREGGAVIFVGF